MKDGNASSGKVFVQQLQEHAAVLNRSKGGKETCRLRHRMGNAKAEATRKSNHVNDINGGTWYCLLV
jgi:hypothetical protein